METLLVSVLSAVLGAGVVIFTNFWRTRYTIKSQDFSKRIEEVSVLIGRLENLACEYWSDKAGSGEKERHYILGLQAKISLIINYLNDQYKNFDEGAISEPLAIFFASCSGGAFSTSKGESEPERIRKVLFDGEKLKIVLMTTRNGMY